MHATQCQFPRAARGRQVPVGGDHCLGQSEVDVGHALHEMSSARAEMYGVLQPRPKAPQPKTPIPPKKPTKEDSRETMTTLHHRCLHVVQGQENAMSAIPKQLLLEQAVQNSSCMRCQSSGTPLWTASRGACPWEQDLTS